MFLESEENKNKILEQQIDKSDNARTSSAFFSIAISAAISSCWAWR